MVMTDGDVVKYRSSRKASYTAQDLRPCVGDRQTPQ